jgi:hypothetical protein
VSAAERARDLIVFCDGFDEGGLYPRFTRRARVVARDLIDALDQLDAERSARIAIQAQRDRLLGIVGGAAYLDLTERLREKAG